MTRSHARTIAIAAMVKRDYAAVAGKVIMLQAVTGYDAKDVLVERLLDPPVAFLVSTEVPDSELTRVCDAWVDPTWDVEPQEPKDPQISDLGSFFCYGPSYHLFSEESEPGDQAEGSPVVTPPPPPAPTPAPTAPPAPTPAPVESTPEPSFRVSFTINGDVVVPARKASAAMLKAYAMTAKDLTEHGTVSGVTMNRVSEIA